MAVEMEAPESTERGGGDYLATAGVFHFAVLEATETPTKRDGGFIPNAAFGVEVEVLAGPCSTKTKELTFFQPDPDKRGSKGFELEAKRNRRFVEAVALNPEPVPGTTKYAVDITKAKGRQFIARLEFDTREGKEKNLRINFADIWHIDDPDPEAKCERNQKAIDLLPKSLRRSPESFSKPADGNGNGAAHTQKPVAAAAPASLDDL